MLSPDYFQIDTNKAEPLYHQIQENLIELIELGLLRPGDLLPSERELSQHYSVTRMTVRQAVDGLVQKGLVQRQQGVGTFIQPRQSVQPFVPTVMGFSQRIRQAGLVPSSQLIECVVVPPTPLIAHRLGIDPLSPVIRLTRLRLVNEEPLMLETSYLSQQRFPDLVTADLANRSLYTYMQEQYDLYVHETEHTLEPVLIDEHEAKLLGLSAGQPAMLVRVLALAANQLPIEYSKSVVRGDRCRYYFRVNTQMPIIT